MVFHITIKDILVKEKKKQKLNLGVLLKFLTCEGIIFAVLVRKQKRCSGSPT